jgi:hypothetical protein
LGYRAGEFAEAGRTCRQQTKKMGTKTKSKDHNVIGSGMALSTAREPETATNPEEPSETLLLLLKLYVPILVMALVSRSKVHDSDAFVNVATSRVDPTTREDITAPAPGPDETLTWLAVIPAQLDGMPEHVKLKAVRADSPVALTEKSYMALALAEAVTRNNVPKTTKHFFIVAPSLFVTSPLTRHTLKPIYSP